MGFIGCVHGEQHPKKAKNILERGVFLKFRLALLSYFLCGVGESKTPRMSKKELTAHELPFLPGNTFSDPSKER